MATKPTHDPRPRVQWQVCTSVREQGEVRRVPCLCVLQAESWLDRGLGKVSKPQGHPTAEPTAVVEVHL